jgi:hypothetical protein
MTNADHSHALGVAERRSREGSATTHCYAMLADCGLRSAGLCRLRGQDLRRSRTNARYDRLYVHGKSGRELAAKVDQLFVIVDALVPRSLGEASCEVTASRLIGEPDALATLPGSTSGAIPWRCTRAWRRRSISLPAPKGSGIR